MRNIKSRAATSLIALILAALIGGMNAAPAFADWHHDRRGPDRHYYDRHHWRGHDRYYGHRPYYYGRPGYYGYAPPPVIYAPPRPAPGVNLFFGFR